MIWTIEVPGKPVAQGSMFAFIPKYGGKPIVSPSNKKELLQWRKNVETAALQAYPLRLKLAEPVMVEVFFYRKQPRSRAGDVFDDGKPDGDKLLRAILDGLTGNMLLDDCYVTDLIGRKRFCDTEEEQRAVIKISSMVRQ